MPSLTPFELKTPQSNYFQGFNEIKLLQIATERNLVIRFLYTQAAYLIKGTVFMEVYSKEPIDNECIEELIATSDFYKGQPIHMNADFGFNQIAEVAIKALSPGINDPGTAVISLHALSDLLAYRLDHKLPSVRCNEKGEPKIFIPTTTFKKIFEKCIYPIWNYGKEDQYIREEMIKMATQLKVADYKKHHSGLFDSLIEKVRKEKSAD